MEQVNDAWYLSVNLSPWYWRVSYDDSDPNQHLASEIERG